MAKKKTTTQPETPQPEAAPAGVETVDVAALQNALAEAQTKSAEYLDGWQRALADFSNYRKRTEREQSQASQVAAGNIIKRFLDVSDDLDRALKNRPADSSWANGIELIYRKLLSIIEAEGVTIIDTQGQFFDPSLHEAISQEDSAEHESGQIIGIVQQGYRLGDRILRPARVRVAR